MRLEVIYFYYKLAGLALREKRMHDLLVGNAINYSLLRLRERIAYFWCEISTLIYLLTQTKTQTAVSAFIRNSAGILRKKNISIRVFSFQNKTALVFLFI